MTKKEMFKQEISDVCKKYYDRLHLLGPEDFDYLNDYRKWFAQINQDRETEIDRICYFYKRSGYLSEDEMFEIIGKLEVPGNVVYKPVNKN